MCCCCACRAFLESNFDMAAASKHGLLLQVWLLAKCKQRQLLSWDSLCMVLMQEAVLKQKHAEHMRIIPHAHQQSSNSTA